MVFSENQPVKHYNNWSSVIGYNSRKLLKTDSEHFKKNPKADMKGWTAPTSFKFSKLVRWSTFWIIYTEDYLNMVKGEWWIQANDDDHHDDNN